VTQPSTTQASGPIDLQLQRAIDTIIALVVLTGDRQSVAAEDAKTLMPSLPTTQPAAATNTTNTTTKATSTPTTAP